MSETPTAREILKSIRAHERLLGAMESITEDDSLAFLLAARVEAVLALLKKYRTIPADLIERILDVGKP